MRNSRSAYIWLSWILIFPIGLWGVYNMFPPDLHDINIDIIAFLMLMILVALFPIIINNTPIFVLQGVSLAVFLIFGLFAEMLLTQLAIVALLLKLRLRKDEVYRFPLNSLMFFFVSLMSALVFYSVGGSHIPNQIFSLSDIWPILVYALTYFLTNQLLLSFISTIVFKQGNRLMGKDLIWECLSSIVVLPIGIALFVLYAELQTIAIVFIGVPLISLALIMRLYYASVKINEHLHTASEIGHELAGRLHESEVLDLFVKKVSEQFPVDYTYIYSKEDHLPIKLIRFVNQDHEQVSEEEYDYSNAFEEIGHHVVQLNRAFLFQYQKDWKEYVTNVQPENAVESILALPIKRNLQIVGVLILASRKKRMYEKYQHVILDILSSYLAVAVENARHYEETKRISEHCALTGAYNYGYFKGVLKKEFQELKKGNINNLVLFMIDLDFFKKINDTYGHESGNQVLCEITNCIKENVKNKGIVVRYGGEEFAVLLPNMSDTEAISLAETIRKEIALTTITVDHDMESINQITIKVTASIGVASANQQDDDHVSLLRNADRAMYIGAKKAGRNKVAVYEK